MMWPVSVPICRISHVCRRDRECGESPGEHIEDSAVDGGSQRGISKKHSCRKMWPVSPSNTLHLLCAFFIILSLFVRTKHSPPPSSFFLKLNDEYQLEDCHAHERRRQLKELSGRLIQWEVEKMERDLTSEQLPVS